MKHLRIDRMRLLMTILVTASLSACASGQRTAAAPEVATTVEPLRFAAETVGSQGSGYVIGPGDKLSMTVFQVPDLSFEEAVVDASGALQLPLLGSVQAAGQTPEELSNDVQQRLAARYLRDPRVAISVLQAASQKVTVDGAVTKPGVYEMRGRTTLMQAVAMAEGPTRVADLRNVAVFRNGEHGRMVALFDLATIRSGQMADPLIMGDDVVVVDTSRLSATMRDVIAALPGLAAFAYF